MNFDKYEKYNAYPWSLAEKYFTWHKYHNK